MVDQFAVNLLWWSKIHAVMIPIIIAHNNPSSLFLKPQDVSIHVFMLPEIFYGIIAKVLLVIKFVFIKLNEVFHVHAPGYVWCGPNSSFLSVLQVLLIIVS